MSSGYENMKPKKLYLIYLHNMRKNKIAFQNVRLKALILYEGIKNSL